MRTMRMGSAVLVALLLAGCGEGPLTPETAVAPQFNKGNGKGGSDGGSSPTASLSGGITTAAPQPVTVVANTATKLEIGSHKVVFMSALALHATIDDQCVITGPATPARLANLLARLSDGTQQRHFNAYVDRTRLNAASSDHHIAHTYEDDAEGGLYTIRLGSSNQRPGDDPVMDEAAPGTFTLSGGTIMMADRSGRTNQHIYVHCPNTNVVTMVFTP